MKPENPGGSHYFFAVGGGRHRDGLRNLFDNPINMQGADKRDITRMGGLQMGDEPIGAETFIVG